MDPEERKLLLENNRILHKLLSAQRWAMFWSVLRWAIIIGLALGSYYYIQPYLDQLLQVYGQVSGQVPQLQNLLPKGLF